MTRKRKSELEADSLFTPVGRDNDHISECSVVTRSQAKKSKLSTDSAVQIAKKFVKHGVFWLPDGNTLVQIEGVRFKLDRNTLVKQSTWFRTMIENPANDSCIYTDGKTRETVYCLDSLKVNVKDFVALLNALDDAVSYVYHSPSTKIVASILRAADPLGFDRFKAFAVSYLEDKWPGDLAKFNGNVMEHAADAALLAERYNVNSALKRALYELVRAQHFKQYTDSDDEDDDHKSNEIVKFHYLWLVHAREKLMAFWIQKAVPPKGNTCASLRESKAYKQCAITRGVVHVLYKVLVHDSEIFFRYRHDPMVGLQALIDAPWILGDVWPPTYPQDLPTVKFGYRICAQCANRWRTMWCKEKEGLWNNLDAWFGL